MPELQIDSTLPELRTELQIKPGIRELDGSMSWLIFDPLRHQYYQIDNKNRQILQLWGAAAAGEIVDRLSEFSVSLEDIEDLLRFLWLNSLTVLPPNGKIDFYLAQSEAKKGRPINRLLHGYLFVRIPLIRPERFLKKTEPLTRLFFTRSWWFFIGFISLSGLFLTSRQWDQFTHTFEHFFSLQGLFYYGVALAFVKCLHELGHGYAATRFGCRVNSMGVAFIVMFPVLFTDTTDSWKLSSRRKRLIISAAGVAVELSLAAIATLMWVFLEDGPLRSTAFFIATTSWMMSVLVNMNPLMRFDAYHFLSDAVGVQNLQARSFALGRWSLREILFGLNEPAPEAMSLRIRRGLTAFAWLTWTYRFFLFLGIALLIHNTVFKPFGSVLGAIELLFFIAIPVMNEFKQWWVRRSELFAGFSGWVTASVLAGLVLAGLIPWQSTIRIPAVLEAMDQSSLYAPGVGQIEQLHVAQGDHVRKGDPLITLGSVEISSKILATQRRIDLTNALLNRIAADADDRGHKIVLQTELRQWQEELTGLQEQESLFHVVAPIDGVVANLNSGLHEGRWVNEQSHLGSVISESGARISGYVSAADLGRIGKGDQAVFIPDVPEQEQVTGAIAILNTANAEYLTIPELASHYDGPIAVNKVDDDLKPLKAWYNVRVDVDTIDQVVTRAVRGTLLAQGDAESLALRFWRRAVHVILREVII